MQVQCGGQRLGDTSWKVYIAPGLRYRLVRDRYVQYLWVTKWPETDYLASHARLLRYRPIFPVNILATGRRQVNIRHY